MELRIRRKKLPTSPAKLSDPLEKDRILMQYAGVFKNNIREYSEKFIKTQKKLINYSR